MHRFIIEFLVKRVIDFRFSPDLCPQNLLFSGARRGVDGAARLFRELWWRR